MPPSSDKNSDLRIFISYSHADDSDFVSRFAEDLAKDYKPKRSIGTDVEVVFLDTPAIRAGKNWEQTITDSLQTCRVMICLYSPSYFNPGFHGKELEFMLQRREAFTKLSRSTEDAPIIIPLLWESKKWLPDALPPRVSKIEYAEKEYGATYGEKGLRYLMQVGETKEYLKFVAAFVDNIISIEKQYAVPAFKPDCSLEAFPDPFETKILLAGSTSQTSKPSVGLALRSAQFFYVAASREEIKPIRKQTEGYGVNGGIDWQPFHPDTKRAIVHMCTEATGAEDFIYENATLCEDLVANLKQAENQDKVAMIVVDVWSLSLDKCYLLIKPLDSFLSANYEILMPMNDGPERLSENALQSTLLRAFPNRYVMPNLSDYVTWSSSASDFSAKLRQALWRAQKRIEGKKMETLPPLHTKRMEPPTVNAMAGKLDSASPS